MPVPILNSISQKSQIPLSTLESYWAEAKKQAYEKGLKKGTPRFYKYVLGIVKNRAGIS